jgi:phosphoenolpyruvate synthase/pyruvate phosphate dikinase
MMEIEKALKEQLRMSIVHDPRKTDVGGKAFGLLAIVEAGLPVPPFLILKPCFAQVHPSRPDVNALNTSIFEAELEKLCPRPWAVRSSAVGEDNEHSSFAGIFKSVLPVFSAEGLFEAVAECLHALDTPKVIAYCTKRRLTPPTEMCIIVQTFVSPVAAGVAFTRDPLNPNRKIVYIESNYGLGTTVVDGSTTPDKWIYDAKNHRIMESFVGTKRYKDIVQNGKIQRLLTPAVERRELTLDSAAVGHIAILATNAESALGRAADVEWVKGNEQIFLLQARPITN